jgi:acyl-coenzyme A thioesterase 9
MDSSGKESIPVLSTVSKLDSNGAGGPSSTAENGNNTGNKPVSMWPGMYHSPVTAALWAARSTILERAMNAPTDGHAQRELLVRTPSQSRTSILYTFSNDEILQEQYRNPWKGVRIGKLLEDLDALAGTIAVKVAFNFIILTPHCNSLSSQLIALCNSGFWKDLGL